MKKIFMIVIAIAVGLSAMAQSKFVPEVVAGMNVSKIDYSDSDSRIGFHVGARCNYYINEVNEGVYVNAGLLLTLKGFKFYDLYLNPYYLELPLNVGYSYPVSEKVSLFGEVGPYFSYGIFGGDDGESVFDKEYGLYHRFDWGIGLRAGVEFERKFNVSLGYQIGIADVCFDESYSSRNLTISLGYKF